MWFRASSLQPSRDGWAEGEHPASDTLVRDGDAALGQEFFDISEAEGEAKIHPDGTLDDVARETVARVRE